ncbi:hypothetical protein [Phaeobacter sp. J2-8]|uniref:hypothetical protein n=1 Tax=Phaeobacter sp. J2-8 TaxID=2931394 RepID=UPI001FD09021|nr:hypothetical protein [Phaeobacter sp. J2-8]MCJ7873325.1 hypothetical protein [Phaeobacter sp. J2-8]
MIFVSHKLEEVQEICDMITVLRDGQHVGTKSMSELDREGIIEMMIGRKIQIETYDQLHTDPKDIVLEARGLTSHGLIEDASFSLRRGEDSGLLRAGWIGAHGTCQNHHRLFAQTRGHAVGCG